MKRVTIMDIARAVGVSKQAVSYALNGQPGVSSATRAQVLETAAKLGWEPNSAARALSRSRSGVVGLVFARPRLLGVEPFFMRLVTGFEGALWPRGGALLLQVVADQDAELESYRRWWAASRVDGVFLQDLYPDDRRVALMGELGMPAVAIGGPGHAGALPAVWSDQPAAMAATVRYLAAMGHRRLARVSGDPGYLHSQVRSDAFFDAANRDGLTGVLRAADYTADGGARATRALLSEPERPTAIIYDNDVMAVAGLGVAEEMGIPVPAALSIVAWDDSQLCQLARPALTALHRDIAATGTRAAELLLRLIDGEPVGDCQEPTAELIPRGSTAPPPSDPNPA